MSFLSRIIRFLFWVVILSWGLSLLQRLVGWMLRAGAPARPAESASTSAPGSTGKNPRLVRDPVCGVHVADAFSIPLREGTETLHFCSTACRDQYVHGTKKLAANG